MVEKQQCPMLCACEMDLWSEIWTTIEDKGIFLAWGGREDRTREFWYVI